jgi:hypothetical protein
MICFEITFFSFFSLCFVSAKVIFTFSEGKTTQEPNGFPKRLQVVVAEYTLAVILACSYLH